MKPKSLYLLALIITNSPSEYNFSWDEDPKLNDSSSACTKQTLPSRSKEDVNETVSVRGWPWTRGVTRKFGWTGVYTSGRWSAGEGASASQGTAPRGTVHGGGAWGWEGNSLPDCHVTEAEDRWALGLDIWRLSNGVKLKTLQGQS